MAEIIDLDERRQRRAESQFDKIERLLDDVASRLDKASEFKAPDGPLARGGGGSDGGSMLARIAMLEQIAENTKTTLGLIQSDLREVRNHQERDFRFLFGVIIAVALGLASLMAHGFHWI